MDHPIIQQLRQQAGAAAAASRNAIAEAQAARGETAQLVQIYKQQANEIAALQNALSRVNIQAQRGDPNIQRVENIPGRRIPFDFLVEIPFNAGNSAVQQGIITIDQTGPFIAVARSATFLSTYTYELLSAGTTTTFNGRSYGRWRPVHSSFDLNDGQPASAVSLAAAFPGTGSPHIMSPANASPFRSMEMDFRIMMREQGSALPRMNIPVPSSIWVKPQGDAFQLGALDFFERSQVIVFDVQPTHTPNQDFGNVSGFTGLNDAWPFAASGWDTIEGINDPAIEEDEDPVTRNPNGVLVIGFHGYRVIQPPGAGQL